MALLFIQNSVPFVKSNEPRSPEAASGRSIQIHFRCGVYVASILWPARLGHTRQAADWRVRIAGADPRPTGA